ncbi:MAG: methyl-accepting chemotaxis sensory [Rhodospirillaceae bacterium]|nr:MAG: methyl-accepting chemotaxis sensory [Rhodospirillaceae bacterium]TNC96757.1 MAG: methyl-accepting chemotaxis sensory transducer [Stygiobacter sp.]
MTHVGLIFMTLSAATIFPVVGDVGVDAPAGENVLSIRQGLGHLVQPIERVFLDMGEHLSESMTALQGVSVAFDRVAGSVNSTDLLEASNHLRIVVEALAGAISRQREESVALHRLGDLTIGLERDLLRLRKTIGEVHPLAINGRIEAAQAVVAGIDFDVFTGEIGRLAAGAAELLDRLGDELVRLSGFIATARSEHAGFDQSEIGALPEVERRLDGSRRTLQARQTALTAAAQRISGFSRANEDRIADVIGALQIGDITRQRLEHVDMALAAADDGRPGDYGIHRLQSMQLADIYADCGRELTGVDDSLEAITQGAGGIIDTVRSTMGSAAGEKASFLHELVADLHIARKLVHQCHRAGDLLQAHLVPVSTVVAEIRGRIESIRSLEADMRIMGLNATFKCSRLGRSGRVLAVIAQELRALAGRTAEDASKIMAGLEEIYGTAQLLAGDGRAGLTRAEGILEGSITAFESASRTLETALANVDTAIQCCLTGIAETRVIAVRQRGAFAVLPQWAGQLRSMAPDTVAESDDSGWHGRGEILAAGYSMASQRAVHARYERGAVAPQSKNTPPVVNADDFLF